jgi:DNA-binding CsgD family transcriptional regulator
MGNSRYQKAEIPEMDKISRSDKLYVQLSILPSRETDPKKVIIELRERIKELNCLYGISRIAEHYSNSIEDFLQNLVNHLPPSWQYPEITCSRIEFAGKIYESEGFKATKWMQSSQIIMQNKPVGEVTVFYLEERPSADEGPFLKEERTLLDAVADLIAAIARRILIEVELNETNKKLTFEQKALHETNIALRMLLNRVEEGKKEIQQHIKANVERIIMPLVNELMLDLPKIKQKYVELLRSNLEQLTAPFIHKLSVAYQSLTPTELKICNMIRNDMRTKEIAQIQKVSVATIKLHREHIRRKLKITNSDINLTTFLQTSMDQ